MKLESINPFDESLVQSYKEHTQSQLNDILSQAHHAWLEWRLIFLYTRAKYIKKLGQVILEKKEELARLITKEMGKPLAQAIAEVEKCAALADYYAHNGPVFLQDQEVQTEAHKSYVTFQPLGIILGIMPWNFPLWQAFRFAIPAVMAGNSAILKHAPNVCGSALAMEEIFHAAGFPKGTFTTVLADIPLTTQIIEHEYVRGVSLTGSERAGQSVAELAGKHLKPVVLELGGSDPYIVFADADFDRAVETCVTSRLINCGQTCISGKRFFVENSIAEKFKEAFVEKMKAKTIGDPMGGVDLGPMARKDLRDELHKQVIQSVGDGARILTGGEVPDRPGYFYPPTVLDQTTSDMAVRKEETFGPVAVIQEFNTELEALRLAQETPYGLGAALFGKDLERLEKLAKYKMNAGAVFINDFVRSDPRLPFGGVKNSGFGRELSHFGLTEFVNIKSVVVQE